MVDKVLGMMRSTLQLMLGCGHFGAAGESEATAIVAGVARPVCVGWTCVAHAVAAFFDVTVRRRSHSMGISTRTSPWSGKTNSADKGKLVGQNNVESLDGPMLGGHLAMVGSC